jgi:hypothetical protein
LYGNKTIPTQGGFWALKKFKLILSVQQVMMVVLKFGNLQEKIL